MSEVEKKPEAEESRKKMCDAWPEIKKASEGKRYEVCLVGADINKLLSANNNCLDANLYKLKHINFLEIAKTTLDALPSDIGALVNLNSLLCHSNNLVTLPAEIGKLVNLKNLDLSNNQLTELPEELKNLKELMTLNLGGNKLTKLFPLEDLSKLAVLDLSRNKFAKLPDDLGSAKLENLSQINASFNELVELNENIAQLPSLKTFNLENNQITQVPACYCQMAKLKDLMLKTNKLKDNRLKKLVEQDKTKAILDYLERIYAEELKSKPKKAAKPAAPAGSIIAIKKSAKVEQVVEYDMIKVLHYSHADDAKLFGTEVVYGNRVAEVRPFIVCCILRNIDLETPGNFKKFLNIQTKLHEETCDKRAAATIATHDIDKLKSNLTYEAKQPEDIELIPLGRCKAITAAEYYNKLYEEAEAERKAKKRNQLSGIYKYLSLLENQTLFAYLRDNFNHVVSLPPLTNSEDTKMSTSTKNILLEITSTKNVEICKKVLEELLVEMIQTGIVSKEISDVCKNMHDLSLKEDEAKKEEEEGDDSTQTVRKLRRTLMIQQVKIVDLKGDLKSVYPSRVDLNFNSNKIQINRVYDE